MLKNLLIKCAELLNRDDILETLKSIDDVEDIDNKQIQNDIVRLIQFYNFTVHAACENYLGLITSEMVKSDVNKKIHYHELNFTPVRILEVRDELGGRVLFDVSPTFILTCTGNKVYQVTYKYVPDCIEKLNEKTQLPRNLNEKTIVYGVVSEFLASKSQFNQSDYWRNKFLDDLFKINIHKERRIKSTFVK